jgi:hypothetical protein
MQTSESTPLTANSNIFVFVVGLIGLLFTLFADPIEILKAVGFPVSKLYGERGQADVAIIRVINLVIAAALIASPILLWKDPQILVKITAAAKGFIAAAIKLPLFTALFLGPYCWRRESCKSPSMFLAIARMPGMILPVP